MQILILTIICFISKPVSEIKHNWFVIRDVGQGSWNTFISDKFCLHFDMGGEYYFPLSKNICKNNIILISHYENDHINFLKKLTKKVRACDYYSNFKIEKCISKYNGFKKIHPLNNKIVPKKNHQSRVFIWKFFLIPGDSLKKQEKIWSKSKSIKNIKILILGHHGSNTSNSKHLLKKLKNLKMLISSSRYKKYGHPNIFVKNRIKSIFNINVITTEEWGNLWFEL